MTTLLLLLTERPAQFTVSTSRHGPFCIPTNYCTYMDSPFIKCPTTDSASSNSC